MRGIMSYLAIALGLLVGSWLASRMIDYLLFAYYHRNCMGGDSYLSLYDFMDSDFNFEMMKGQKGAPKNYAEFLRLHEKTRPFAVKIFQENIKAILKFVASRYFLLLVLPAVVFMGRWYLYVIPVLAVHLGFILYKRLVKGYSIDFYAILMQITVINEHRLKDK
jgi:hypothetical protein